MGLFCTCSNSSETIEWEIPLQDVSVSNMWFITWIEGCLVSCDIWSTICSAIFNRISQVEYGTASPDPRRCYRFIHQIFQHNLNLDSEWFHINWNRFALILWPVCMHRLSGMNAMRDTLEYEIGRYRTRHTRQPTPDTMARRDRIDIIICVGTNRNNTCVVRYQKRRESVE